MGWDTLPRTTLCLLTRYCMAAVNAQMEEAADLLYALTA